MRAKTLSPAAGQPLKQTIYSMLDSIATRDQLDLVPRHWRDALSDTFQHNQDGLQQLNQDCKGLITIGATGIDVDVCAST